MTNDLVQAAQAGEAPAVPKITSAAIRAALRVHFDAPAFAVFFEVSNDTGARSKTYTDAVAMGIWPSTGQEIIGIEIKVSRSDWLREAKNPAKTSPMFDNCDRFYLACPSGMVSASEVPLNWGVLHFDGTRMKVAKKAPLLTPQPLSRGLMAALIRRAGALDSETIAVAVSRALVAERADIERRIESAVKRATEHRIAEHRDAAKKLARIEEITGIKMDGWDATAERVGRAIKAVHESGVEDTHSRLLYLSTELAALSKQLQRAIDEAGIKRDKQS